MAKKYYSLVGVDGNAFAVMGYTAKTLKETGNGNLVDEMHEEATSGNYYNLLAVCDDYINIANKSLEKGMESNKLIELLEGGIDKKYQEHYKQGIADEKARQKGELCQACNLD